MLNSHRLDMLEKSHTVFYALEEVADLPMNTWKAAVTGTIAGPGVYLVLFSGLAYTTTAWLKYRIRVGGVSINGDAGTWQPTHQGMWHSTVFQHVVTIEGAEDVVLALEYMNTNHPITSLKNCIINVTRAM